MNRRRCPRKYLYPIHVAEITVTGPSLVVARYGTVLNASATGLLVRVSHPDLHPEIYRHNPPLQAIEGKEVVMTIVEMNLKIGGKVVRAQQAEPGLCEVAIDFTANAPPYWRECLVDLLPTPGEIAQGDSLWASDLQAIRVVRPHD